MVRLDSRIVLKALLALFIFGIVAKAAFVFTILPPYQLSNIPADYGAGVAQLVSLGIQFPQADLDVMTSVDMQGFPYTTYWPYLPFTNYFRGLLVLLSGHNMAVFDAFYIVLIILSDIAIFLLIQKILALQGFFREKSMAAGLLYFLNPMTFDNLRWRSTNNFMLVLLLLAVYLYLKRKEVAATFSLGLSISMKILPVFVFPFVLLKALPARVWEAKAPHLRKVAFLVLLAFGVALLTAVPTLMYDAGSFLTNSFLWGGGVHGGNLSDSVQFISFLTLLNVAGIGRAFPSLLGSLFMLAMFALMFYAYFKLRDRDIALQAFVIFAIFFLMHNIIETHHFVILFGLFALVVWRSEKLQRWAFAYALLPVLWYFATPTAYGTRLLAKLGVTPIPHGLIVIASILVIKAVMLLVLVEAFKLRTLEAKATA